MKYTFQLALLLAGVFVTPAMAATHRVPAEFATINAALDASVAGDTVLVGPGTYTEFETRSYPFGTISSVAFLVDGVTLRSEGGSEAVFLRMDESAPGAPIICFGYQVLEDSLVEGFTFSGNAVGVSGLQFSFGGLCVVRDCTFSGLGGGVAGGGLGVASVRSDMEIYGCDFLDISGPSAGGILQESSTLLIEDCEFRNVRSGAIQLSLDSGNPHPASLAMRRCVFIDNEKTTGDGGAIAVYYPQVLIEDCWFENNRSIGSSNGGGAISAALLGASNRVIRNCTFVDNRVTTGNGGSIRISGGTTEISGNTIFGSHQDIEWETGGSAVYWTGGGSHTLRNNAIVNSTGNQAVGISSGALVTSCNIYFNNPLGHTSGFPLDATDLVVDPLFCDPTVGDFHVDSTSLCLPANNPSCDELIGAWAQGCGTVSIKAESWGRIKERYRAVPEEKRP